MEFGPSEVELDTFDHKILAILAVNGRITVTDLAREVGLSKTPCQVRLRRLIETGVIAGFQAVMDPARLGLDHVAFTEVKLSDTRERALEEFNMAVRKISEVEECHMIASSFDYLLKVRTADIVLCLVRGFQAFRLLRAPLPLWPWRRSKIAD